MKIAFFVYPSAFQSPGGGEILLLKTKEALEMKGVSVKLFNQWEDKLKDFDILHIFGSVKDCLGLMHTAKSLNVKIVLSPIFWSSFQRAIHEEGAGLKKATLVAHHMAKVLCPYLPSERRRMFLLADALVPNAQAEADQVAKLFAVSKEKMHVVNLGADERFAHADPLEFRKKYNINDFILSAGRVEPRKNQLNLIRAMKGARLPLVLIGSAVSEYKDYYQQCRKDADRTTIFIDRFEHGSSLLSSAYAACSVFVLQGWFETPGLVALEAGLAGARLAVTQVGSTREYFGDRVAYLDPADQKSIRLAVEKALSKEKDQTLKTHIFDHFLWSHSADTQVKIYKSLLT